MVRHLRGTMALSMAAVALAAVGGVAGFGVVAQRELAELTVAPAYALRMRRLDELHLEHPFAGSRMLQGPLLAEGHVTGRLHVATLMKRMAIEALYRRPNTSKPAPGHKVYPYLLRGVAVTRRIVDRSKSGIGSDT